MIALIIWIGGFGYAYDVRPSWDECQAAMTALNKVGIESSCHIIDEGEPA